MKSLTFEKNRVINFSDAIFSIAMTLLVLEVGIPSAKAISTYETWELLQYRIPNFIGFIVSFLVTAIYWVSHLRTMKFVSTVDSKILWLNIFLLLFIVLMPFSTGLYVGGFDFVGPFVFYCFNLTGIGVFNFLLINYVIKKENSHPELTPQAIKWYKYTALNALIIWVLAGILAFVLPFVAKMIFILIFVIQFFINRNYNAKEKRIIDNT